MRLKRVTVTMLLMTNVLFISGCKSVVHTDPEKENQPHKMHVTAGMVLRDTILLPLFIPGKLFTSAQLKLGFKTGGIIRELYASEGANIKKGSRIALLDTVEFVAWRNKAQTGIEKAQRDLERTKKLYSDSVATLEQLQNAQSAFDAAQSDLSITLYNFSQAELTAPTNGKILKRLAEKCEVIGPGMPVVIFASTAGKWSVKASIPDCDLSVISIGDSATVSFNALPERVFSASLVRIGGAAHPVTGTFEIELALNANNHSFRSGLIADIRLYPKQQKHMAFIPASSLVDGKGKYGTVFSIVSNDSFVPVSVTVARLYKNLLAISAGLDGIDQIVVTGAPYVLHSTKQITIDDQMESQLCKR